jgi:hypothetical protein
MQTSGPSPRPPGTPMTAEPFPAEFETITEAEVDSRGRVSLGRAGAEPGRRYRVQRNIDGVLLLIPVISFPVREAIVWENPQLAAEIRQGLDAAERGETEDLGTFAEYLDDDDDDVSE